MKFSKIKLSNKLFLGFGSMFLIIVLISSLAIYDLNQVSSDINTVVNVDNKKLSLAYDMKKGVDIMAIAIKRISNIDRCKYRL